MSNTTLHKILAVEDDSDIREIMELSLEAVGGYEICLCSSGADAIKKIKDFKPDLVMLDVMMPEMDGPTTLCKMQQLNLLDGIPVIFLTAKVQVNEVLNYKNLGAVDVIPKPFDPMALPQKINQIWNNYNGSK